MIKKLIFEKLKFIIPLVAALIFGLFFFRENTETTNNAYTEANIAYLSSEISGSVESINFQENLFVHKGDLLISIDDEIYNNRYILANAGYEIALSNREKTSLKLEQIGYDIIKIESDIAVANAELSLTSSNYKREKDLLDRKVISQQKFDIAKTDLAKLQNKLEGLKAILIRNKKELRIAEIEDKQSELHLMKAEADLKIAKKQIENTKIRAPFDGYTANKTTEVGNFVNVGSPLVAIVPKEVYIVANFKETQIRKIKIGQKVEIKLDAFPKAKLQGEIESISAGSGAIFSLLPPMNATGNFTKIVQRYPIKIKFTNKGGIEDLIKPGLSAEVKVGIN